MFPFSLKLTKRIVIAVTLLITVCSIAFRTPSMKNTSYEPFGNDTYVCRERWPDQASFFLGNLGMLCCIIWIPLVILVVTQIMMYKRLKRETGSIHGETTNQSRFRQLSKAIKTFRIVVFVFAICTVPFTLQMHLITYLIYDRPFWMKHRDVMMEVYHGLFILMSTNCIWNAAIYGKIHRHIFRVCRRSHNGRENSFPLNEKRSRANTTQSNITDTSNP